MAVAAVTPRVRTVAICDEVIASQTEAGVFTLEGVRQRITAQSFPWTANLSLFMILTSPRKGKYDGKILVVNERNDRRVRYSKFVAAFDENNEILPVYVELGDCLFPEAGTYNFEVYFSAPGGGEALKGELPLVVVSPEE